MDISRHKCYVFTKHKDTCSGCGACKQACKFHAISMISDNEGFLFPVLNKDKCIECGTCDKICPCVGNKKENATQEQSCYIATTKRKDYYQESASIGICTMVSEYIISNGGYVFGAYLNENIWKLEHILVAQKEGLNKIRNSKYLQSDTGETFIEAKKLLDENKTVLYIGTPCQIAGLKSFLRKEYANLYTIDLICHGVFSPKLMPLEVNYWENKLKGKIKNFRFRSKRVFKNQNGGMVNFDLTKKNKVIHIERFAKSSPSYRCFAYAGDNNSYNLRLFCYSCLFKAKSRYGDLTVGDPWFINDTCITNPILKSSNVIRTLYSVNTTKGIFLKKAIIPFLIEEKLSWNLSFCQPAVHATKRLIPPLREILYSKLDTTDYGELVEHLLNCDLDLAQKKFESKYKLYIIKTIIKKILPLNLIWKIKKLISTI